MAIRSDSYGSVDEVTALTRRFLRGNAAYSVSTRPTLTEVEKFIDRASGILNVALWRHGFNPSSVRSNSTAKLACDEWVTTKAVTFAELTNPGAGHNESESTRTKFVYNLHKHAAEFVEMNLLGFKNMGIAAADATSEGLTFTGLSKHSERSDPDNTSREQPLFRRHQFRNPGGR